MPISHEVHRIALSDKGHYWSWCGYCGYMVKCGTCGNNTCSGGSGYLDEECETPCPDCDEAYSIHKNPNPEQTTKLHSFLDRMVHAVRGYAFKIERLEEIAAEATYSHEFEQILKQARKADDERRAADAADTSLEDLIADWEKEDVRPEAEKQAEALNHRGQTLFRAFRDAHEANDYTETEWREMLTKLLRAQRWEDVAQDAQTMLLKVMQRARLY